MSAWRNLSAGWVAVALVSTIFCHTARADTIVTGSQGNLAASATFSVSSGHLIMSLTNTASAASVDPASTLTCVFFNYSGSMSFAPSSAKLTGFPGGSQAYADVGGVWTPFTSAMAVTDPGNTYDTTGNVAGEWGFGSNYSNINGTAEGFGILSAGLASFTRIDTNQNLAGPESLDGNQFGLMSMATLSQPVPSALGGNNNNPLAANSVTFDLGTITNFDPAKLTDVQFIYGTALGEGQFTGGQVGNPPPSVPLPSVAWTGLALMAGLMLSRGWRRRDRALA